MIECGTITVFVTNQRSLSSRLARLLTLSVATNVTSLPVLQCPYVNVEHVASSFTLNLIKNIFSFLIPAIKYSSTPNKVF